MDLVAHQALRRGPGGRKSRTCISLPNAGFAIQGCREGQLRDLKRALKPCRPVTIEAPESLNETPETPTSPW